MAYGLKACSCHPLRLTLYMHAIDQFGVFLFLQNPMCHCHIVIEHENAFELIQKRTSIGLVALKTVPIRDRSQTLVGGS